MIAFTKHLFLNFKFGLRDKTLLLMNYLFPLAFYFVIGAIMPKLNPEFSDLMIPGMIIFVIIVSTLLGMPNDIVNSRNDGIYRSYKINGISKVTTLLVPVISTAFHCFIVSLIILFTAPVLYEAGNDFKYGSLLLVFLFMYLTCSGIALIFGNIADNTSVTGLLAQLIFLPSMLIGGLMFPASQLPESLVKVGAVLPTTYAMDLFQALNNIETAAYSVTTSTVLLLSCSIICYLAAFYLFRADANDKTKNKWVAAAILLPFVIHILMI